MKINKTVFSFIMLIATTALHANPGTPAPSQSFISPLIEFLAPSKGVVDGSGRGDFTVALRYGEDIDPASFRAFVGGVEVTGFFTPEPGKVEVVRLTTVHGTHSLDVLAAPAPESESAISSQSLSSRKFTQNITISRVQPSLSVRSVDGQDLPPEAKAVLENKKKKEKKAQLDK